jgi:hypothetical protein
MNCDMAFDLMTDAEGSQTSALARHLDECPRCRQMQETLAPALDFLAKSALGHSARKLAPAFDDLPPAGSRSRAPSLSVETLKIAEQAARNLAARSETPRQRLQRRIGLSLRYATAFAAGLLLAITLFQPRNAAAPTGENCTRGDAVRDDRQRSNAEIRALSLSCANCHDAPQKESDERSASLDSQGNVQFDRLAALLVALIVPHSTAA